MLAKHLSLIAQRACARSPDGRRRTRRAKPPAALDRHGVVGQGRLMEGVVVSAKKDGSTITISVATDDKGRFSFPAQQARARPVRAQHSRHRLRPRRSAKRRRRRRPDRQRRHQARARPRTSPKQMSNAEWFASFPGTDDEKKALLNCVSCHDLDRIVRSQYDGEQFVDIFNRDGRLLPRQHAGASAAARRQRAAHARPRRRTCGWSRSISPRSI